MGRPKKLSNMTPEEKLARKKKLAAAWQRAYRKKLRAEKVQTREHKRAVAAKKQRRRRRKMTLTGRRQRARVDGARCYGWEHLLPHIDKQPDGHWLWTGPLRELFGRVRPVVRAGLMGKEYVDFVVCCLAHRRPPTTRCFPKKLCSEVLCVAPDHLAWSVRVLERARRKQGDGHVQEEDRRRDEDPGRA